MRVMRPFNQNFSTYLISIYLILPFIILQQKIVRCQILVPLKSSSSINTGHGHNTSPAAGECPGIETFVKVMGVELSPENRIPLYSSSPGTSITAECYNKCRSSPSCLAFWIDYTTSSCYRLGPQPFAVQEININFTRAASYFERICLQGEICNKAWAAERIPGYELAGYDDVIIRSVVNRKRCIELCLTDKRLPCRSADYWDSRKECRLSREDRRTVPGSFIRSSSEVEYIESTCSERLETLSGEHCDWEIMRGYSFPLGDFSVKADNVEECQKNCEDYAAFKCRSLTFDSISGICYLSGSDAASTSMSILEHIESRIYSQKNPCIDMSLECRGNSMLAKLRTHSPFYGKMYSSTLSSDCEVFGKGKLSTIIEYPLSGCGISRDNEGSYIGNLVVQNHPLIQKRGDAAFRLICSFPEINRTLTQNIGFDKVSESRLVEASEAAIPTPILGLGTSIINATAKSPSVKLRITDKAGNDVTGVSLGDEIYLIIEVESNSAYGVFARDLVATSGTKEEELVLMDSRGCPEDPTIFPHFKKVSTDSKSLKGRFEAFKFTNDAVVRFQVFLQFCRDECIAIKCDGEPSYGRRKRGISSKDYGESNQIVELQKEIIVSGPSKDRKGKSLIDNENDSALSIKSSKNGTYLCGPKNLLIATIIGVCILQVLIIFLCASCICHNRRNNKSKLNEPTYSSATSSRPPSTDLFYSINNRSNGIANKLRTFRIPH